MNFLNYPHQYQLQNQYRKPPGTDVESHFPTSDNNYKSISLR